ncbi:MULTISPECIES: ATP-grasp domain-containing protein [Paenibacillus]|uniref:ATP-grasp domain-containing protein n=2 Tax=Paenibacillus pabuli TaxID=1472 RepID=A0A855YE67_9BACL|nr:MULTISPECIES: ATP-grasp domain-containing protein [Paenibacillus]PWW45458.1 ATP-grasp domain-containing protein [Paenibacillus pabuli]PXW11795.1 ATP-grasp domain-containing protein [Paenibacillus taichungensis]
MRTVIINRFSPNTVNYEEWLSGINSEFIIFSKHKHIEHFGEFFDEKIGYDNIDTDERVYSEIVQLHQTKEIDWIIAAHEFDLLKAGQLREYLNIKGQTAESALAFRDKVVMKEKVSEVANVPAFVRINHVFDLMEFKKKHGLPIVIKPVDSAASVGVKIVRDETDFERLLANGLDKNLEAECFVDGDMYHIDGLYENNKILLYSPSRYINGCLAFQDNNYLGSVMLDKEDLLYERLQQTLLTVLNALPVPDHPIAFHAEFFHTGNDQILLCEVACRVGGGEINEGVKYATGIDILQESIRSQCGQTIKLNQTSNRLTGWMLVPPQNGKLLSVNANLPFEWVLKCTIKEENIGKTFNGAESSVDAIASLLIYGDSQTEIENRLHMLYLWFQENTVWEYRTEPVIIGHTHE